MPIRSRGVDVADFGLQVLIFSGFRLDASDNFSYHLFLIHRIVETVELHYEKGLCLS